jgi:hypothetical protein
VRLLQPHEPGGQEQDRQRQPLGRQKEQEEAGLPQAPGIEEADEHREHHADEAFAQEPGHQAEKKGGGPLKRGRFLPAQQEVEGGGQGQGNQVVREYLQVQGEKADAAQEDEASQPGGLPAQQAPAQEIGDPDFAQGYSQGGGSGGPVRDPEDFVGQQVEPV